MRRLKCLPINKQKISICLCRLHLEERRDNHCPHDGFVTQGCRPPTRTNDVTENFGNTISRKLCQTVGRLAVKLNA